jgi:hypothetical protein
MLAIACAIRNRGSLEGVYGGMSKRIWNQPAWVWELARRAWLISKDVDIVKGADHWESTDFKVPYWARNMIITCIIGKHIFYRQLKLALEFYDDQGRRYRTDEEGNLYDQNGARIYREG